MHIQMVRLNALAPLSQGGEVAVVGSRQASCGFLEIDGVEGKEREGRMNSAAPSSLFQDCPRQGGHFLAGFPRGSGGREDAYSIRGYKSAGRRRGARKTPFSDAGRLLGSGRTPGGEGATGAASRGRFRGGAREGPGGCFFGSKIFVSQTLFRVQLRSQVSNLTKFAGNKIRRTN